MFTLVHCHVRRRHQWLSIEAEALLLDTLLTQYEDVRLYVKNADERVGVIDLKALLPELTPESYALTVSTWLSQVDPTWVIYDPQYKPLDRVGVLQKRDLWSLPVTVDMGNALYGEGVEVPLGLNKDLRIKTTQSEVEDLLAENALFSVNGRILNSVFNNGYTFVQNALPFLGNKDQPIVSVLDFHALGKLTKLPIDSSNCTPIIPTEKDKTLEKHRVKVTTSMDLTEKTVLLVADGYPHFLDQVVQVYDAHTVILHLSDTLMARRMMRDTALGWVGADGTNVRDTGLLLDTFDPYEQITRGTSFLVVIHNHDINRSTRLLGRTDLPGTYTLTYPPSGIVLAENGDLLEYGLEGYDGNQATIVVKNNLRSFYMDQHIAEGKSRTLTQTERQPKQRTYMEARLIDLYTTQKL